MDEKDLIAKNITYYRKKLNLSQLELAEKLQYSNKNISKWEKGETTPSIFTLKRLAEVFEITIDQLVSEDGEIKDSQQMETLQNSSLLTKTATEVNNESNSKTQNKPSALLTKVLYLLMANAILLVVACIGIYVLSMFPQIAFNKWLLLLYILPLSALSIFIFIACVKKRVDVFSISISGWLLAVSIYATFPKVTGIGYIFFLMGALQILTLFILLIINRHIIIRIWKKNNKLNKKS